MLELFDKLCLRILLFQELGEGMAAEPTKHLIFPLRCQPIALPGPLSDRNRLLDPCINSGGDVIK